MAGLYPIGNFTLGTASLKIGATPRIPLILAQKTAGGSATSGALIENIGNEAGTGAALAGAGSIGQIMIDAFKGVNQYGRLDAILVSDNGSGVAASGTVAFTATPTESGTLYVTVGSYTNNRYELAITTSSTATTIGDDLVSAITADTNAPVTAVNTTGSVALTAKSKGTEGNKIGLRVEGSVAGVSVALTAFASGATDPSLSGVLDKIDASRYDIVTELAFLSTVKTQLEAKFNASNQILDGLGFVCNMDTYANLQTALAAGTLASQVICYFCNKKVSDSDWKGGALLEMPYAITAQLAAMRALRFVPGAILNPFMQAGNTRGGSFMASIPYQNMKLVNSTTIPAGKGFSQVETLGLADLGGSTLSMDTGGSVAVTNPFYLTCYKTATPTAIGLTYSTVNRNDTATTAREYFFVNLKENFAQSALTSGSIPADPNIKIANEKSIRAYMVSLWQDLVNNAILQGGITEDGIGLQEEFNQNLEINVDTSTGIVSGSMAFRLMGQLYEFDFDLTPNL